MSDVALYRKYRSSSFDAVIGQPQVVETLKNAIASDRLSHAYLFTGPRGTGKTSVARLLARAANCLENDPVKRPCGVCENCKVDIGGHLDLIEIDAASNRGIDDARALREKITSAPSMGRYKVYIIDEVHMLTNEAFNALLKTLEEPPAHAIFILATTEVHKLPETIISRTQRFSFRPIRKDGMIPHLKEIAAEEGIAIDDAALELIAETSHGGFRDAISLLDQVGSNGVAELDLPAVRRLLGHSDPELLKRITDAVAAGEPAVALQSLDVAVEQGVQASQFASQLIEYWRAQLKIAASSQPAEAHVLARRIDVMMPVLRSAWPELSLETALVQLSTAAPALVTAPPAATAASPKPSPGKSVPAPEPEQAPVRASSATDQELWVKTLTQIKQRNNSLYALLRASVSTRFEDDKLMLGCRFSFHRDRLKEDKNMQIIEQALARVYGKKIRVIAEIDGAAQSSSPAVANDTSSELVSSALEILGGEVVHE